jgi:hypothetical protein
MAVGAGHVPQTQGCAGQIAVDDPAALCGPFAGGHVVKEESAFALDLGVFAVTKLK